MKFINNILKKLKLFKKNKSIENDVQDYDIKLTDKKIEQIIGHMLKYFDTNHHDISNIELSLQMCSELRLKQEEILDVINILMEKGMIRRSNKYD